MNSKDICNPTLVDILKGKPVVGIKGDTHTEFVRFCNPTTGAAIDLTTPNVQYDLPKTAFLTGKSVQVGIHDFENDPASGMNKLCIDRVILR